MIHASGQEQSGEHRSNGHVRDISSFALYGPREIGTIDSPLQISYSGGGDGLLPNSLVVVRARMTGTMGFPVQWELDTEKLPASVKSRVHDILKGAEQTKESPLAVLGELYSATQASSTNCWSISQARLAASSSLKHQMIQPIIPSLHQFIVEPSSEIRSYHARKEIDGRLVIIRASIDTEANVVRFSVKDGQDDKLLAERYVVPGSPTAVCRESVDDVRGRLMVVMGTAIESFYDGGLRTFRQHMASIARQSGLEAFPRKAQFLFRKEFPWGSIVKLAVRPDSTTVTISSKTWREDAGAENRPTVYRWKIDNQKRDKQVALANALETILPEFAIVQGDASILGAVSELNRIADSQSFIAAPVEGVLGQELTQTLRNIPGLKVRRVSQRHRMRAEHIADVLRGIDLVEISTSHCPQTKVNPQTIHTLELGVVPNNAPVVAGDDLQQRDNNLTQPVGASLRITAWNRINNRIHAMISAESIAKAGGYERVVQQLAESLSDQAGRKYPWTERARFLTLLRRLENFDERSWVVQMGDARFPGALDIQSHRLIDQIAAPVISSFCRWTNNAATESFITSPGDRNVQIVLGEPYQPYGLELDIHDSVLKGASVIPRVELPDGSTLLARDRASIFELEIPLADRDADKSSQRTIHQITRLFANLVSSDVINSARDFRISPLRRYLGRLSAGL